MCDGRTRQPDFLFTALRVHDTQAVWPMKRWSKPPLPPPCLWCIYLCCTIILCCNMLHAYAHVSMVQDDSWSWAMKDKPHLVSSLLPSNASLFNLRPRCCRPGKHSSQGKRSKRCWRLIFVGLIMIWCYIPPNVAISWGTRLLDILSRLLLWKGKFKFHFYFFIFQMDHQ